MEKPRGPQPEEPIPPSLRRTVKRARFRLGVVEWLALGGAVAMALVGGLLLAFLISEWLGLPFRSVWAAASLILFIVPASAFLLGRGQD